MRIGRHTNALTCEIEMQARFMAWLRSDYLSRYDLEFIDELRIPEVGRIADFIVWKPGNGLINIEAKGTINSTLYHQLKDHSLYCDYSFAFIPDYAIVPKWFKRKLYEYNWGLIVFNYRTKEITEAIEAHKNKEINKNLGNIIRCRMIGEIVKRQSAKQAEKEIQQELDL